MSFPTYIRTVTEKGTETHLTGISDTCMCGLDHAGDDAIHLKAPVVIKDGRKHRVTCSHCVGLIAIAAEHLNCR